MAQNSGAAAPSTYEMCAVVVEARVGQVQGVAGPGVEQRAEGRHQRRVRRRRDARNGHEHFRLRLRRRGKVKRVQLDHLAIDKTKIRPNKNNPQEMTI
jgi:hypothetical protein